MKSKNYLSILFSVLLFGGLWGIFEATVGSFLHLPFIHKTIFLSSTTILVPIAYLFMGLCYKKTETPLSVFGMGALAGLIKLFVCLIFKLDPTPSYYIMLEALTMGTAIAVIRPKEILSFKSLGTLILANTLYLSFSAFIRFRNIAYTSEMVMSYFEKYVFELNCIAILYAFIVGAALYGIKVLATNKGWNFEKINKVIYHPAFASSIAAVAVVLTIVLR